MIAVFPAGQPYRFGRQSFSPAQQLALIVHLMGDLHQPLHCATNADAGGNCVRTSGFSSTELHGAWDTELVNRLKLAGRNGRRAADDVTLAAMLDSEFSAQFADITAGTSIEAMAMESHDLAFAVAYAPLQSGGLEVQPVWHTVSTLCGRAPSYEQPPEAVIAAPRFNLTVYYPEGPRASTRSLQEQAVARQLAAAGYRLADLLNRLFP